MAQRLHLIRQHCRSWHCCDVSIPYQPTFRDATSPSYGFWGTLQVPGMKEIKEPSCGILQSSHGFSEPEAASQTPSNQEISPPSVLRCCYCVRACNSGPSIFYVGRAEMIPLCFHRGLRFPRARSWEQGHVASILGLPSLACC